MSYNKREFYRGNWQKGVMSGKGLEQFEDGSKYEGEFENGLKHGKGSLSFLDGTYYLGEFKKNKLGGYGVQEGVNFRYVGEWKDNIMHGTGRCDFFSDAKVLTESYIGQYDHGVRHGYGEYHWLNGQVYKGQWSQGAITGKGIFIRPTRTNLVRDP